MTSGILEQVVTIKNTDKSHATHFALCKGTRVRYLIDFSGKKRLSHNISTYSGNLSLLMKALPFTPFAALSAGGIAYYVKCELKPEVKKKINDLKKTHWNMIVGTYGPQQKVVLQCFDRDQSAIFLKIGNAATASEMHNETEFLKRKVRFDSFHIPELVDVGVSDGELIFQATKEFTGDKVDPILTEEIVRVYREIASIETDDDREFSHGDFAPWNMKRYGDSYIVFDWEFCGLRVKGYDLLHYVVSIKMLLEKKSLDEAIIEGIEEIKRFIPDFTTDRIRFQEQFLKTH